jgi:hypothetical protein
MDDNLHPKSCENRRFTIAKFPNMIVKLIHQMWDVMVSMIAIEKDNKMVTTSKGAQIDVEGSSMIRVPKKTIKNDNKGKRGEDDWQLRHEEMSKRPC